MPTKNHKKLTKIEKLLLNWEEMCQPRKIPEDEPRLKVHQMVKKLGWGYEKMRALIEGGRGHQECYQAIRRILKRMLLMEKRKHEKVPQLLVEELIRGGFLENNKVPKKDLKIVWNILDKYIVLMSKVSVKISQQIINKNIPKQYAKKRKREINRWIVQLAARELEKFLLPVNKEEVLVKSMYEYMAEQFDIEDETLSEQEKKVQVYIAVQRAFIKAEDGILAYYLFKLQCPNWSACDDDDLEQIAKKIFKIKEKIESQLHHSMGERLRRICNRNVVYFIVLLDMINNAGAKGFAKLLKNKSELEKKIAKAIEVSYRRLRKRVRIGLVKNTLYIFITKFIMVEIPLSQGYDLSLLEFLGVLFIGPMTMIIVGLFIRVPSKKNTKKIIKVFNRMFYESKIRTTPYKVKQVATPFLANLSFALIYLLIFAGIILGIYKGLGYFGFRIITTSATLFFFSMISYFAFRLRAIMREFVVLDRKENFIGFLFDFIALPILKLGRMLARIIDKLNLSKRFMDYILETPFKAFVNFFENWTLFVKEKKDELDQGEH